VNVIPRQSPTPSTKHMNFNHHLLKNRAAVNIWILEPTDCRITPIIMIIHPVITPTRRPPISAIYGVIGSATMDPTDMIALRSPRVAALGLLKAMKLATIHGEEGESYSPSTGRVLADRSS
jgi:hypothetical protein